MCCNRDTRFWLSRSFRSGALRADWETNTRRNSEAPLRHSPPNSKTGCLAKSPWQHGVYNGLDYLFVEYFYHSQSNVTMFLLFPTLCSWCSYSGSTVYGKSEPLSRGSLSIPRNSIAKTSSHPIVVPHVVEGCLNDLTCVQPYADFICADPHRKGACSFEFEFRSTRSYCSLVRSLLHR